MNNNEERIKKRKISRINSLERYIKEFNQDFHVIDEENIYCNHCKRTIKVAKGQGQTPILEHVRTKKHHINLNNSLLNQDIESSTKEDFNFKILNWMLVNNIPISKLDDSNFTDLFQECFSVKLYSSSHYRKKLLPSLYKERKKEIYAKFKKTPFYIMFDESPDSNQRKIVNVLIGELDEKQAHKPFILNTYEEDSINGENIATNITFLVCGILKDAAMKNNFKVLISDKAAYCLKAGRILKETFTNLIHITCLCHSLHNFSEFIRKISPKCVKFESEFKKFFKYKRILKKKFKEKTTVTFPKLPISTRFGTFVTFYNYIYENYQKIRNFIDDLPDTEDIKLLFNSDEFIFEVEKINEYKNLPKYITQLETNNISVPKQMGIIKDFLGELKDEKAILEFERILKTNPGYEYFCNYSILKCSQENRLLNFCPLTSVWAERSFSSYSYILNPLRRKLKVKTMKMLLSFYFIKK